MNLGTLLTTSRRGWKGTGSLWTQLPAESRLAASKAPDDTWHAKVPWFRATPGQVRVTAEPLGGAPTSFRAIVGTIHEYGPTGFAPSDLSFGRLGCWRLTARLGPSSLSVTVLVTAARAG